MSIDDIQFPPKLSRNGEDFWYNWYPIQHIMVHSMKITETKWFRTYPGREFFPYLAFIGMNGTHIVDTSQKENTSNQGYPAKRAPSAMR